MKKDPKTGKRPVVKAEKPDGKTKKSPASFGTKPGGKIRVTKDRSSGSPGGAAQSETAQENIFRLNRLYSILSKINEAIVRIREPEELYERVCRIAVEDGLFKMAWIGLKDPETRVVKAVARWGDTGGYLETIKVVADDVPEGRGPTGRAVFEGKHFICSDIERDPIMSPWRDKALSHGFRTSAGFPLHIGPDVIGALTIYAGQPSYFTEEEIMLLVSMAEDVSFAMSSIENERRRQAAEDELKRLNEELEHKVAERTTKLEAANKELETFSYSVSHDLRAPLRTISGFSQILMDDHAGKLDDEMKKHLNIIRNNTRRMDLLINALLDLSRIGRQRMKIAGVDMERLVKSMIAGTVESLSGRQISFDVKTLPPARGDLVLLRQVFENLISNAVKFTAPKDSASVEVGGWTEEKENVYYVKDNGAGFDMKYGEKLFGAFQRLHSLREFEGTGIGLSIVRRIIRRHGGRVWAEGRVNEGATFFFSLPE